MSKLHKRAELLANIAIVIVAILLSVVLVKRFVLESSQPPSPAAANQIAPGQRISLEGIDWAKSGHTVLLVLQKGCHYCTESAPFYQRLIKETANRNDVKLIAIFPQSVTEGKEYLDKIKVDIADIRQVDLNQLRIGGTPTLILVNESGVAVDVWKGKLPPDVESDVLSKLKA
jgi:thiol-disulfide isomerase/thioredoxin